MKTSEISNNSRYFLSRILKFNWMKCIIYKNERMAFAEKFTETGIAKNFSLARVLASQSLKIAVTGVVKWLKLHGDLERSECICSCIFFALYLPPLIKLYLLMKLISLSTVMRYLNSWAVLKY